MVFGGLQLISFEDIHCVPSLTQPQRLQSAQAVEDKRQFKSNCRNLDYTETILSCTVFFLFVCLLPVCSLPISATLVSSWKQKRF